MAAATHLLWRCLEAANRHRVRHRNWRRLFGWRHKCRFVNTIGVGRSRGADVVASACRARKQAAATPARARHQQYRRRHHLSHVFFMLSYGKHRRESNLGRLAGGILKLIIFAVKRLASLGQKWRISHLRARVYNSIIPA